MISSKELFDLFEPIITEICKDSYQFIVNYEKSEIVIDLNLSNDDYISMKTKFDGKMPITLNINKY